MNLPIHLILAAAAEPAADAASSQPKQPIVENIMQDTRTTLEQLHEQGPGFFSNLWEQHSDDVLRFARVVILALVVIVAAMLISMAMKRIIYRSMKKIEAMDESLSHVTYTIVRTIIWIIGVLIILDLFGFNTASILTVLGAAGLAIGLAMKDSLSNIAAGIMLIILRPYRQGDYIDCGSISGSIQEMGLFSTTLKTPDGLFVSAPNSVVFGTPIKNYSRNPTRRSDITVGVAYSDSLPVALQAMQELLNAEPLVLKDPAPEVLVSELADSSVQLTLRYWTKTGDYWDAFWSVKSKLKPQIENAGLNIPFPQRVVTFVNGPKSLE